ncbi:probable serine/threonine-protein kinase DDB_G0282963 isoform X2 [Condylostylus longicornis]|uniref:probable serine/threonine-protein kinase DDB_G0282963 isoform X2 n=2 Tax=Condylostylus longicornis TaxID=2530218 RepID=UPI00244DD3A4|nr:probable serine/threonine-protein kinase DDB_G0282963 isoform X2 [Condylostylus longicornis]
MPSLSPSQSSTDQSSSTTTTTATSIGTNNLSSSSSLSHNERRNTNETTKNYNDKTITTTSKSSVLHRKKLLHVVTFLDQQNQRLEKELQNEKTRRNEELSRIVKSLLYFEAKLKSEKKVINQKLYEKDDEIAKLVKLNKLLREKLTEKNPECNPENLLETEFNDMECKYPEAFFCTNCRKEFYGLNEKCDNWTQTSGKITDCRGSFKGENNNNNNNNNQNNISTEHCSSSDETLSSSFYGARRSVRYTSKRTFGTFREYMRSRCMNIDDPSIENNQNLSEDENRSTLLNYERCFINQGGSNNKYKKDKTFSSAMERLHGVRRVSSFEFDSSEAENRGRRKKFSSSGPETDHEHTNSPNDEGIEDDDIDEDIEDDEFDDARDISYEGANVGVVTTASNVKEFSEISVKHDFETSTDDWYASASDGDDDQNSSVCRTKSYGYNAVNPVLECVNQILLQQSMEECINDRIVDNKENHYDNSCNGPMSIEGIDSNNGGFSVCSGGSNKGINNVNSVLSNTSGGSNVSRKRVHFSTKNSMVHVPRDDDEIIEEKSCSFSDVLNSSVTSEHHSNNLNYESIYSNEYEPIGSEHNSSNLYVDMESKLDQDEKHNNMKTRSSQQQNHNNNNNQQSQTKQPPALPPKPANLIKFKRGIKMSPIPPTYRHSIEVMSPLQPIDDNSNGGTKLTKELLDKVDCDKDYTKYGSVEPDYCSISEVNVAIKTMQIVADVHKSNDANSFASSATTSVSGDSNSDTMSQKTSDDAEEIFADIPKLPNVAAIIAPSKNKSSNKSPKKCKYTNCKRTDTCNHLNQTQQLPGSLQLQQKQQINSPQQQPQQQPDQKQLQQQQQQLRPQSLQLYRPKSPGQVQRKHVPNILAEINKKIQQANNTTIALNSPGSPNNNNKMTSNFFNSINTTKRKPVQSNQLLPILKGSSQLTTSNCGINNSITNGIINTKNFNNALLGNQQQQLQPIVNPLPTTVKPASSRPLKSIDSTKLNQQQNKVSTLSSSTQLSPSIKNQYQQQKQNNQFSLNQKQSSSQNNNKLNLQQPQQQQQTKIEDSTLEAEFDWYNLDAEYGKSSNRPDIIKAADVLNGCLNEYIIGNVNSLGIGNNGNLRDHHRLANDINQSIEYNLDEEFSLSNQPDIIKENIRTIDDRKTLETIPGSDPESNNSSPKKSSTTTTTTTNITGHEESIYNVIEELNNDDDNDSVLKNQIKNHEATNVIDENKLKDVNLSDSMKKQETTLTVINKFPTICDQTPCRQSVVNLKTTKNFVDFIDNAGLSTKPLPQQRKIYFTGPFV